MKIITTNKLNNDNVNISLIRGTPTYSDDVIQYKDLSILTNENLLPSFGGYLTSKINSDSTLTTISESMNTMITGIYNINYDTNQKYPLWYKHDLHNIYYNKSGKRYLVTLQNVVQNKFYRLLATNDNYVIAENTLHIWVVSGGIQSDLNTSNYIFDISTNSVAITLDPNQYTGAVHVEFYAIAPEIVVTDSDGDAVDKYSMKLVVNKYETTPNDSYHFNEITTPNQEYLNNLYYATIYTNLHQSEEVYTLEYKSFYNMAEVTKTEIINQTTIYNKVDNLGIDKFEYTIDPNTLIVHTKIDPLLGEAFSLYPNRNSKIGIIEPKGRTIEHPWYLEFPKDQFTKDYDISGNTTTLTYTIEDEQYPIDIITERANRVNGEMMRTDYPNLYIIRTNDIIDNVTITTNGKDVSNYIKDADETNGLVYIDDNMPYDPNNTIIQYQTTTDNYIYKDLNLNPSVYFGQTKDVMTKEFIIFTIPKEYIRDGANRTIFHHYYYKHFYMHYDGSNKNDTFEHAWDYITGSTIETDFVDYYGTHLSGIIPNVYKLYSKYLKPPIDLSGTSVIDNYRIVSLGIVIVSNNVTPKSLETKDIRVRGGGLADNQEEWEVLDAVKRQLLDIAFIDGYPINLENIAQVTISQIIVDNLIDKMQKYDTDLIRILRATPDYDVELYAKNFVEKVIRKYMRAGAHFEVKYVN